MKIFNQQLYFVLIALISFCIGSCFSVSVDEEKRKEYEREWQIKEEKEERVLNQLTTKYGIESDFLDISSNLFTKDLKNFKEKVYFIKEENLEYEKHIENSKFYANVDGSPLTRFELDIPFSELSSFRNKLSPEKGIIFKLIGVSYFTEDINQTWGEMNECELDIDMIYRKIEGELLELF